MSGPFSVEQSPARLFHDGASLPLAICPAHLFHALLVPVYLGHQSDALVTVIYPVRLSH